MSSSRSSLTPKRIVMSIAALIALIYAGYSIFGQMFVEPPPPLPVVNQSWYYDLREKRLFASAVEELPPVNSPWNHPSVRAHVYACGECTEQDRFIAYIEVFSYESKGTQERIESREQSGKAVPEDDRIRAIVKDGHGIRGVDGVEWVPFYSEMGSEIRKKARDRSRCPEGVKLVKCNPPTALN